MNEIFLMKPSKSKISHSVKSYDEKTSKNCRNFYDTEKRIISKLSKISIRNFNSTILRLDLTLYQNLSSLSSTLFMIEAVKERRVGMGRVVHFKSHE